MSLLKHFACLEYVMLDTLKLILIKVLSSKPYEKSLVLWSQQNLVFQGQLLLKNFRPEWLVSRPNHAITPLSVIQSTAFTLSLPLKYFSPFDGEDRNIRSIWQPIKSHFFCPRLLILFYLNLLLSVLSKMHFTVSILNPLNKNRIFLFLFILCSITVSVIIYSELFIMKFTKMTRGFLFSYTVTLGTYRKFRHVRLSFFFVTPLREWKAPQNYAT